jgi:hypothetical protein
MAAAELLEFLVLLKKRSASMRWAASKATNGGYS